MMASEEARNVEAVDRWCRDVFEGDLGLLDDLFVYPYVRHFRTGTVSYELAARRELVETVMENIPGLRWDVHDIIARGDLVGCRLSATQVDAESGEREVHSSWIEIHRLVDGKIAETWQAPRLGEAGSWEGESLAPEDWSIGSSAARTSEEAANLATLNRWADLNQNRSDEFGDLTELVTDPNTFHGPRGVIVRGAEPQAEQLATWINERPEMSGRWHDTTLVGDRAFVRFEYHLPGEEPSLQCGIAMYRLEGHRIAEIWQVHLGDNVGWS